MVASLKWTSWSCNMLIFCKSIWFFGFWFLDLSSIPWFFLQKLNCQVVTPAIHHDPQLWYTTEWSWTSLRDLAPAHGASLTLVDPRDVIVGDKKFTYKTHTPTFYMAGNVSREWGVFLKAFRGESCEDMYIYMYFSRHSWTQPVSFKDTLALEEMFSQIQNVSRCTSHGHRKNEINIASSILTFPLETAKGINRFFSAQIFIYRPSQWKVYHPEFSAPERKKNSLETKNPVELRGQPVKRGRSIWESGICPNKKEGFRCLSCVILSCHSCQTIWLLWPTL